MFKIIALCGYKRCGKDTVANYIIDKYHYEHLKISQNLKTICKQLFDLSDQQIECDEKEIIDERWNTTPRKIMQFVGTEMFQYQIQGVLPNIGRSFWIQKTINEMSQNMSLTNFVISDMRFMHEYDSLKRYRPDDIIVIKINRPIRSCVLPDQHVSEEEWKQIPVDYIIENNYTLEHLQMQIDDIMYKITFNQI